jgi:hypothetical protein
VKVPAQESRSPKVPALSVDYGARRADITEVSHYRCILARRVCLSSTEARGSPLRAFGSFAGPNGLVSETPAGFYADTTTLCLFLHFPLGLLSSPTCEDGVKGLSVAWLVLIVYPSECGRGTHVR